MARPERAPRAERLLRRAARARGTSLRFELFAAALAEAAREAPKAAATVAREGAPWARKEEAR